MFISWLVKGLAVTAKKLLAPKITERYPEVYPDLPPPTRSAFIFYPEKCTTCKLCELACPNKVIGVEIAKNLDGKRKLTEYRMSLGYCMYCGMCAEVCPVAAILMQPQFTPAYYDKLSSLACWKGPDS